jgi:hypothetical protein
MLAGDAVDRLQRARIDVSVDDFVSFLAFESGKRRFLGRVLRG